MMIVNVDLRVLGEMLSGMPKKWHKNRFLNVLSRYNFFDLQ